MDVCFKESPLRLEIHKVLATATESSWTVKNGHAISS